MYDFLLVFGVVLWAGLLAWYLRQPAASAFHPASYYFLFHGVLFTLRPILARLQGFEGIYRAYQFNPTPDDKIVVLLGADLALAVFVLTAVRIGNLPFTRAAGTTRLEEQPRFTRSLWVGAAACLPIALAALAYSWQSRVGGTTMVLEGGSGVYVNTGTSGYFTDSMLMLGPIAVLFAWAGRFRWWSLLPLGGFILFKAGTGGRWPLIMALMSAVLFWMYERRLRWFPPRALLGAVPLLFLFTFMGADRGATIRHWVTGEQITASANLFSERPLEAMDYANLEFFEYLVHTIPKKTGTFDYFLSNLQLFTEPVPRVVWPGKPIGAPVKLFTLFDYGYPIGMTFSVPGAGWMEAGWIGIVLWAGIFGFTYGKIYQLYVRSPQQRYQTALFMVFLPMSLACFRDGMLLTIAKTSFFTLLPILVWRGLRVLDPVDETRLGLPARS